MGCAGVGGKEAGSCISAEKLAQPPGQIIFAAGNGILFLESVSVPKGLIHCGRFLTWREGLPKRKTVLVRLHVCLFSGVSDSPLRTDASGEREVNSPSPRATTLSACLKAN